jgi:hypothetical protein
MTGRIGQEEQGMQKRTDRTRQAKRDRQKMTVRTGQTKLGQPEQDSWKGGAD